MIDWFMQMTRLTFHDFSTIFRFDSSILSRTTWASHVTCLILPSFKRVIFITDFSVLSCSWTKSKDHSSPGIKDMKRILGMNCTLTHRLSSVLPYPLSTYTESDMIRKRQLLTFPESFFQSILCKRINKPMFWKRIEVNTEILTCAMRSWICWINITTS